MKQLSREHDFFIRHNKPEMLPKVIRADRFAYKIRSKITRKCKRTQGNLIEQIITVWRARRTKIAAEIPLKIEIFHGFKLIPFER